MNKNNRHSLCPTKYIAMILMTALLVAHSVLAKPENPSETLTLDQAIETALENNPRIAARLYEKNAAEARQNMAFSSRLPQIGLSGSFSHYHEDRMISPRRPGGADTLQFTDQPLGGDITIHMPLFTGGQLINESRAKKLLLEAAGHDLARNRGELVFNINSIFYNILAQRHSIEAFEFSCTTLREHCSHIQELIDAKKAARVDLLRTEVQLNDLEQRLTQEKNILAIQNHILMNLMGIPYTTTQNVFVIGQLDPDDETIPPIETSLNQALLSRPDYLAAKATLSARDREICAARGLRSPSFSLKGSLGNEWDSHNFEEDNQTGVIMLEMDIPLFSGGYISAKVREKKAIHSVAFENLRQLELQIQLDVETAILNIGSSYERISSTGKNIEQAKESLRIEREKHAYSKGSITDVLDAQSALLKAQMNYYRSLADYKTAQAQYQLAVGNNS